MLESFLKCHLRICGCCVRKDKWSPHTPSFKTKYIDEYDMNSKQLLSYKRQSNIHGGNDKINIKLINRKVCVQERSFLSLLRSKFVSYCV